MNRHDSPYNQSYSQRRRAEQRALSSPPSRLLRRSQSESAAHYSRQVQHIVAQHRQRDGPPEIIHLEDAEFESDAALPTLQPPLLTPQMRSQSLNTPPTSSGSTPRLARYSLPALHSTTTSSTPSPSKSALRNSWNSRPSSTRSADQTSADTSYAIRFQKLRMEHGKLQESHQALSQDNSKLQSQSEELKTKTVQLEARLLESMQARSAREHKFQDEMKRQRVSMNSLYTQLADTKLQVELLKKQLQDTTAKLALQQALTANIAFQQEQEELEYQMEMEQYRKQQQQQQQKQLGESREIPSENAPDYEQDDARSVYSNNTRNSGFSQLGNFFNRRKVVATNTSGAAMITTYGTISSTGAASETSSSAAAPSFSPLKSSSELIGPFQSYEESKNDLFEQIQLGGKAHTLFDFDTTTTATTTEASSSANLAPMYATSERYIQTIVPTPPPNMIKPLVGKHQEEMNYGQTSAGMPPVAPMSRLDRIRQKRRNLENMFLKNGAGSTVTTGLTANSTLSSASSSSNASSIIPRGGTTNFRARNNHPKINLMNHRRHDD